MEPAQTIITKCGGVGVVAGWLGLNHSTVLRWTYARKDGGTDGVIPAKHQGALISKAVSAGVAITPADFFPDFPANDSAREDAA